MRDKTRPPGRKPNPTATVAQVLALTQSEPTGEATHWTGRAMAKTVGLSRRTVQRIWEAHRLQRIASAPSNTTTLFAVLNTLDGVVLGRCRQRHRQQQFIRFLNAVERAVPAGKLVHAIVDNCATHTHPKVKAWLARHPRWTFHFTPKSGS